MIVDGTISKVSKVVSGVPQGTVLGPILFLLLINDIDRHVTNKVSLFCDDTRVMGPVDTEEDVEKLQEDLDLIYSWQQENNMLFNGKKFEMLRYGTNEELKFATNYFTPELEDIIEVKNNLRDLGVIMSDNAKFEEYITHVCLKVKQKCGWILRTFSSRNSQLMKFLWKSLVQGHIDYCSQLYLPNKVAEMQQIENLQKWYTSKIPELNGLNYWQRLKFLKMNSQQRRLERYRIIYTWKILEGIAPNCGLEVNLNDRRGREVKVPTLKGKPAVRKLREQSFQYNGPRLFNSLPKCLRGISKVSVEEFKEKLDKYLQNIPDEPNVEGLTPSACDLYSAAPSNSLVDQSRNSKLRRPGA